MCLSVQSLRMNVFQYFLFHLNIFNFDVKEDKWLRFTCVNWFWSDSLAHSARSHTHTHTLIHPNTYQHSIFSLLLRLFRGWLLFDACKIHILWTDIQEYLLVVNVMSLFHFNRFCFRKQIRRTIFILNVKLLQANYLTKSLKRKKRTKLSKNVAKSIRRKMTLFRYMAIYDKLT